MRKFIILLIIQAILVLLPAGVYAQGHDPSLEDTTRYFPSEKDFTQPVGWQIINRKENMQSRTLTSQTILGYRYMVDLETAPRTGLSFQVAVTLVRPGQVQDPSLNATVTRSQYAFNRAVEETSRGYFKAAQPAIYGDESFEAQQNFNNCRILVRRGDFLIEVIGSIDLVNRPDLPDLRETCHYIAKFVDSRLFGARLGLFVPVQSVIDPGIPMVAGKKMILYASVETEKGRPFPKNYVLRIAMDPQQGFRREAYEIPLNAKGAVQFDINTDFSDGSIWSHESAEPVVIDKEHASVLRIQEHPRYDTRLYRFMLDPVNPDYPGDYVFKVNIVDSITGSKLWDHVFKVPTRQSARLRLAIVPVPIGYWSPAEHWKIDEWIWLSRMENRSWEQRSYVRTIAELPEEAQKRFALSPRIKEYLTKHLPTSRGKFAYNESANRGREFLKGAFPIAEESFEITIFEDFPEDFAVDPHPEDLKTVLDALESWGNKNKYHRVIGVVPGSNPLDGGVAYYLEDVTGQQVWYGRNAAIVPVNASPFRYAHDLLHTFGGIDEWLPEEVGQAIRSLTPSPLNLPLGRDTGQPVFDGYWVQKKEFRGTPLKSVHSVMGLKEPAWIPGRIYVELFKLFLRQMP